MESKEVVARVYVLSFFLMNSIRLFAGFTMKCRCTDGEPIFYIRRLFISKRDTKKSHWDTKLMIAFSFWMEAYHIFRLEILCSLRLVNKLNNPQMTAVSVDVLRLTIELTSNYQKTNS